MGKITLTLIALISIFTIASCESSEQGNNKNNADDKKTIPADWSAALSECYVELQDSGFPQDMGKKTCDCMISGFSDMMTFAEYNLFQQRMLNAEELGEQPALSDLETANQIMSTLTNCMGNTNTFEMTENWKNEELKEANSECVSSQENQEVASEMQIDVVDFCQCLISDISTKVPYVSYSRTYNMDAPESQEDQMVLRAMTEAFSGCLGFR